jgi:hypothetical protein
VRFRWREITPRRVGSALNRRLADAPHLLAWSLPTESTYENRQVLNTYRARHRGERCFVIGNGPSLARMDLSKLAGEVTFGANRIYLLESSGFRPTYFVCSNELVLEQYRVDIAGLPMQKFLNWNRRHLFDPASQNVAYFRLRLQLFDRFGTTPLRALSSGGTVTYVSLQLAYFMGFREVILIGVDHDFVDKGTPNVTEVRKQPRDENHFDPNYFPRGSRWQPPDLRRSEVAYAIARETFARAGGRILDATLGGRCTVFEKVEYASLFASRRRESGSNSGVNAGENPRPVGGESSWPAG